MSSEPDVAVIVVAAGRGSRAGPGRTKLLRPLAGATVLERTLRAVSATPDLATVVVVANPDDEAAIAHLVQRTPAAARTRIVRGGETRHDSVGQGLRALEADSPGIVLVHDGARPFVSPTLLARAVTAAREHGAAVPVLAVTDTVKEVDAGRVLCTPERSRLRAVQTPQAFRFQQLSDAHQALQAADAEAITDDASVIERAGGWVTTFEGDPGNVKLTTTDDFAVAEARLAPLVTRTTFGYDVHAFGPGNHVMLGGVRLPHDAGVVAHSDGDVVLHALTDALLAVIGDGDIGRHFPPSDSRWQGHASDHFLRFAAARVRDRGGVIDHLDATVVAEAPKIGAHVDAMRAAIADAAGVAVDAVSVKATTSERLGFIGRRDGLAAYAIATCRLSPASRSP